MICVACNNTKCKNADSKLDGINLEMFNFVCCLELTESEDTQGICNFCLDELKVSFNFKKRCLEIFTNVFEHENDQCDDDDDNFMDSILDQSFCEDDSINLNDLLIPEVCIGHTALSALDVSDNRKCRYCFKEFVSKEECQEHLEEHRGDDKPYKCPHDGCDSTFKARKNLKDHYLVHSNERPFPCHYCTQTFKSSSNRSKHERRIHAEERKASRQLDNANGHQSTSKENIKKEPIKAPSTAITKTKKEPIAVADANDSDRNFKCDYEGCTSSFRTRSSLKDHQKVHSDERPYQCHYCSSAFKSSSNRSKHERGTHPKEYQKRKLERESTTRQSNNNESPQTLDEEVVAVPPPAKKPKIAMQSPKNHNSSTSHSMPAVKQKYQCRYCDRVFNFADGRDRHETVHKFFDCGFCSKNFKTQELLKEHTRIHTEQTKFICQHPSCDEIFSDRRSMRAHRLEAHDPEEFICEVEECGKIFPSARSLKNHKKYKHVESSDMDTINCDICLQKFNRDEIQEHLKLHI